MYAKTKGLNTITWPVYLIITIQMVLSNNLQEGTLRFVCRLLSKVIAKTNKLRVKL